MKVAIVLVLSLFTQMIFASAIRNPKEDYLVAARRNLSQNKIRKAGGQSISAFDASKPYNQLSFKNVPRWSDLKTLKNNFNYVRNLVYLPDPDETQMKRRSSWFYPDDGCWIRAQLMNINLRKKNLKAAGKVFIFGNLNVATKYSPSGEVSWWYHVVPLVMVGGMPYVLDPAINSGNALPLKSWVLRQVSRVEDAKLAVCHANTFGPDSDCNAPSAPQVDYVKESQLSYLSDERARLTELGLDLDKYLGKNPPF